MSDFDALWRASLRYRRASRELEILLRAVFESFGDDEMLAATLEGLLTFLATPENRTDANCSVTDHFIAATEERWRGSSLDPILDDMSGTLHDSVHAEVIARTFEATPEQLLARLRNR
jgi:hypothetical protein